MSTTWIKLNNSTVNDIFVSKTIQANHIVDQLLLSDLNLIKWYKHLLKYADKNLGSCFLNLSDIVVSQNGVSLWTEFFYLY